MKWSILIAAVLAAVVAAWVLSGRITNGGAPDGKPEAAAVIDPVARGDGAPLRVGVRTMDARMRGSDITLFGRTEAERTVSLRSETAGRVVERAVLKGETVAAGAVVVRLAQDDRADRLREAEALLQQRTIAYEAALKLAQKSFRSEVSLAEEKANLESARAGLAAIRLDIARTRLHAPFDGVVDALPVEIGDYVRVGDVVATLVDLDPILIVAEVAEREVAGLHPGRRARARLVTGEWLEGSVRFVSKVGREATRTFRVEVEVDNPDRLIAEGLTAELVLPLETVRAHRVSPAVLTLSDDGRVGVKTVDAAGVVAFAPVGVIDDTPDGIWLSGLPDRVTVITVGQEFVLPGQTVVPVPEAEPEGKPGSAS